MNEVTLTEQTECTEWVEMSLLSRGLHVADGIPLLEESYLSPSVCLCCLHVLIAEFL